MIRIGEIKRNCKHNTVEPFYADTKGTRKSVRIMEMTRDRSS